MSKHAKPNNGETSTSQLVKSAFETEKDIKSERHTKQSVSHSVRPIEQSIETAETVREIGGQKGPEPTRFGDWEKNGRCTDF